MAHDPPKNPRSSETPESSDSKGLMQTTPDPNLPAGLYEHLITELLQQRLEALPPDHFYIQQQPVDPAEAARYLTGHLSQLIRFALNEVPTSQRPLAQIELANKIIRLIAREIDTVDLQHDLLATQGHLLEAIINRIDQPHADLRARVREIMPHTRLSQSELFTGNRAGVSLESEIKKEIASADEICWLVSFIKFSGIRTLLPTLREFTQHRRFRIITTSYMGATDLKAIRELAALPNTEIKVSYDALHERLHAKAYLFLRNSGFHTGYIGSSNLSRSALTSGLEWNMKVTTREVAHIIDKFRKTFDTYWEDGDFERFDPASDTDRLRQALQSQRNSTLRGAGTADDPDAPIGVFFELSPKPFQREILERFHTERTLHGRRRNLLVAATGTGKTVISAFDFKRYRQANPSARLLFIAHRKEILQQARHTFRHVLRDANFGELWVDGHTPDRLEVLFASVQTFNSQIDRLAALGADYYDFIIIDEVHHLTASSYRTVLQRFTPDVLLGLTATPERMDGGDITEDFDGRIAAEIRLPEALNRKLLCPFQYFGVTDQIDLRQVNWKNGKYDAGELTRIFTADHIEARQRVQSILDALERYCTDPAAVRTLGFCVTKEHARYMAEAFQKAGYQADVLLGDTPRDEREAMRSRLREGKLNYLFVVDVFNEGVDIPEVDTVLFLRPTESLTVFLQQLGRGLRLSEGKDILTVLDFVGNARPEYDFEHKFRALIGRTRQSVQKEIEHDFPHLPLGCSIVLERQAREVILENIRRATSLNRRKMVQRIQQFRHQSTKPLSWSNFLTFHHLEPAALYKYKVDSKLIGWNRLCVEAGVREDFSEPQEMELSRYIGTRLLTTQSDSYYRFVLALMDVGCDLDALTRAQDLGHDSETLRLFGLTLHYDVWQTDGPSSGSDSLSESLLRLQSNPVMLSEVRTVCEHLLNELDIIEKPYDFEHAFPLHIHGRYNRDQILVAMRLHTWERVSSNREGVANNNDINAESLFITLNKSEQDYSPSTLYEDYALNEQLFHWQSQNASVPERGRGLSYVEHLQNGKEILMFVREHNKDHNGLTMNYVFLGPCEYVDHEGARPMNIQWSLSEPIPTYLLNESRKLAVG
jgi:superfamily II DNA or RNA helicase/HKD family nuclease